MNDKMRAAMRVDENEVDPKIYEDAFKQEDPIEKERGVILDGGRRPEKESVLIGPGTKYDTKEKVLALVEEKGDSIVYVDGRRFLATANNIVTIREAAGMNMSKAAEAAEAATAIRNTMIGLSASEADRVAKVMSKTPKPNRSSRRKQERNKK